MSFEYEGVRRVQYESGAIFVPVCKTCGRFVKAREYVYIYPEGGLKGGEPTADCSQCGPTFMIFEGFGHDI